MRPRLETVQALRGAACLLVVLFHAGQFETRFGLGFNPLKPFLWFGYAGVDLFFAISGFVIAYAHRDQFGRPRVVPAFLFRRAWRIYPVYWVALAAAAAAHFGMFRILPPAPGGPDQWWAAVALMPAPDGVQPWVPQAWSLAYELAFYLTFAVLLCLPRRWAAAAGAAWFGLVAAAGLTGWWPGRFIPLWVAPLVAEFLLGAAVGLTLTTGGRRRAGAALACAAGWLAVGLGATFDRDPARLMMDPGLRAVVFGVPFGLVVFAAAAADLAGGARVPRWLVVIGEASYPVYLVHLLTQTGVFLLWCWLDLGHSRVPHLLWAAATVGAAVGAGWVLHRLVEKPLLGLAKRRRPAGREESRGEVPRRQAA
jgi:peptidoglycan/LPS O-acetylase OafA/YrhL